MFANTTTLGNIATGAVRAKLPRDRSGMITVQYDTFGFPSAPQRILSYTYNEFYITIYIIIASSLILQEVAIDCSIDSCFLLRMEPALTSEELPGRVVQQSRRHPTPGRAIRNLQNCFQGEAPWLAISRGCRVPRILGKGRI